MTTTRYPAVELLEIAQWIEDDALGEDQEVADYARGIAKRIRERAAAIGDQWCCETCKWLAEEGL